MDCFQILLFLLLISSCHCRGSGCGCSIEEQNAGMGPDEGGCQAFEPPQAVMNRSVIEPDQTAPYPFPPYPVLRE